MNKKKVKKITKNFMTEKSKYRSDTIPLAPWEEPVS